MREGFAEGGFREGGFCGGRVSWREGFAERRVSPWRRRQPQLIHGEGGTTVSSRRGRTHGCRRSRRGREEARRARVSFSLGREGN